MSIPPSLAQLSFTQPCISTLLTGSMRDPIDETGSSLPLSWCLSMTGNIRQRLHHTASKSLYCLQQRWGARLGYAELSTAMF